MDLPKKPRVSKKTTEYRKKWKAVATAKKDRRRLMNEVLAPLEGTPEPIKRIL